MGDSCDFARLGGGELSCSTRDGSSNCGGRVCVRENNDGSAAPEVGVGAGVERRERR